MKPIGPIKSSSSVAELLTLVIVTAACFAVVLCLPTAASQDDEFEQQQQHSESLVKLPALFDFKHYQRVFKKKYGSKLEEARRWTYYWASLVKVYVAGIAFKFRRQSYYLALNGMSDWSPEELGQMETRVPPEDLDTTLIEDSKNLGLNIKGTEDLHPEVKSREKREADAESQQEPRELSMDMLMQSNDPVAEPAEVLAKWDKHPKSNNKEYGRLKLESKAGGLIHQQVEIDQFIPEYSLENYGGPNIKVKVEAKPQTSSLFENLMQVLSLCSSKEAEEDRPEAIHDKPVLLNETFVDLRETGCMFKPRDQGRCGSCYAFAGIALAEFLYCKMTGELVEFSEQYMIDCGKGRFPGMAGCAGARASNGANFIHNYGLELRQHYPYEGHESECPYDDQKTNIKATGFIRMDLDSYAIVPVAMWHELVKAAPIYVHLNIPRDFALYGGKVHDGRACKGTIHVMLVVGHGRENGQEFWLMRNSYGTSWGEKGYFKLAKSAHKNCIRLQAGYVYGTEDGLQYQLKPMPNELNGGAMLKRLQALKQHASD